MNRDQLLKDARQHYDLGALAAARGACESILHAQPADAAALTLMAAIAADERRTEEGLRWARLAATADPAAPGPHYVMGRLCQDEGRLAEAETHYRRSLGLKADQPKALNNLGVVLQMQGKLDQALESYRRALALDPALAQANQNLASILHDRRGLEAAAEGYRRAAAANRADAEACVNLGNVQRELGHLGEALESFAEALRRNPQSAQAHFSRGETLLLGGELAEGWKEYEWRWKVKGLGTPPREFTQPMWNGEDLTGKTLLLHAEQGLGDTLQFVRYAALAAARGGAVVLECQAPLAALLRGTAGVSRVVAAGEALPPFDVQLPLMSLPRVFGTTLRDIPWHGAYLRPPTAKKIDSGKRPRVGLAWAGRPQHWNDRNRSIALPLLVPLGAVDAAFYSLQLGEAAAQAKSAPAGMPLIDLTAGIADFADTAALIGQLDLVISVDTAVAHLAGAMGVPVWLLLPFAPDWRWLLGRDDSPWYPSMRLFRRQSEGGWERVVERVALELRSLV